MDDQERWRRNCEDNNNRQLLSRYGWLPECEIQYRFNSHGFRSCEFDRATSVLCLGCSFTMGIGLPLEQTWPWILQQKTGIKCWNLGLGGVGLDTIFRIAEYYVHHLNVIAVACLVPDMGRIELFIDGEPEIANWINDPSDNSFFRAWILDDENAKINRRKNLLAINKICDVVGAAFVYFENFLEQIPTEPKARDLMHVGHAGQSAIADRFLSMLSPIMHK